ncbi:hypothetical protein BCR35DRAFT_307830 [Leucosporidium creatinivorum]|uniref:Uncharacterized protein n=1 Tax=Leucosporidium creatinivorum TaxID=106004 RepID=A0A1Y2EHM1_9BASI|nr:hypothetical protein BCR35DRAFT_307830 [Leucosporidium creatinivorum]
MMALPPPPFPTRFDDGDDKSAPTSNAFASWPEAGETVQEQEQRNAKWETVKTEQETYLEGLEGKLERLAHPALASTSNGDSGYGSHEPKLDIPEDVEDSIAEEDVDYGSGPEDEATREGVALLWRDLEEDEGLSDRETEETPAGSPSKHVLVIPATPSGGDDDEDDEDDSEEEHGDGVLAYRMPAELADDVQNRRISFSGSVRISGGIRSSSKSHRHRRPPPFADLFTPALPPNANPLPSHGLPRNASISSISNSRSGSPSRPSSSHGRSLSSSSLLPLYQQPVAREAYSVYSSSPSSQLQSRSSSPCSSIYAPLQAPKNHCPSPMFVPIISKRKPSSSGLSFKDYLRGRDYRSDGESDEEVFRGYRELVERQRRKRERWERRRQRELDLERGTGSFWTKVSDLLAIGAAGSRARGGGVGYGATATTSLGSRGRRGSAPEEERRARRARSRLSISSDGIDDESSSDEEEEEAQHLANKRSAASGAGGRGSSTPKIKTEEDVRFGTAPGRWITISWWKYKIGEWWKSLVSLLEWSARKEEASRREGMYESL